MTVRSEPTPPGAGAGADAPCDATVQTAPLPAALADRGEDQASSPIESGLSRQGASTQAAVSG